MQIFFNISIFIIGYILGSLNASLIYSKWIKNSDIRKSGSGNAGATNFARKNSFGSGMLVSFLDWTKVVFLTVILWSIKIQSSGDFSHIYIQIAVIGCFIGHVWPIFFNFKGGKGVSSFLGIVMSFNVIAGIIIIVSFWVVVYFVDKISIASISVTILIIFLSLIPWFNHGILTTMMNNYPYWVSPVMFSVTSIMIIYFHRKNITRLIKGEESSFRDSVLHKTPGCKLFKK